MLTIIRSVAIVDRTGALQHAVRGTELDVLDLRDGDLDADPPDVDVLLIGSHELSGAGLQRLARWRRQQSAGVTVVHLDGPPVDRATLREAGVQHLVRGRLTPAKLRTALVHADITLAELVTAAHQHDGDVVDDDAPSLDDALSLEATPSMDDAPALDDALSLEAAPSMDDAPSLEVHHSGASDVDTELLAKPALYDGARVGTETSTSRPTGRLARLLTLTSAAGARGRTLLAAAWLRAGLARRLAPRRGHRYL
jgi:hypothetical protein